MPDRWEEFHFTIASGGVLETESFTLSGGDGEVTEIVVVVPNGHVNLTRLRIFYEDSQVVPRTTGAWVRGNNRQYKFDIRDKPIGQGWKVKGDNNGTMNHTFHIYFGIDELTPPTPPLALVLLPLADEALGVVTTPLSGPATLLPGENVTPGLLPPAE